MDFSKRYQKAEEAYKKRNYDYAIENYLYVLQMDPNETKARSLLHAIIVKKQEDGTYKQAGRLGRTGFAAKIKTLQLKKAWDQVISECDRQVTQDVENPNILKSLGAALLAAGHVEGCVQAYEMARKLAPKDAEIYRSLGAAFEQQGDIKTAIKFWEQASKLNPQDADAVRRVRDLNAKQSSKIWEGDDDYRSKIRSEKMAEALEEDQKAIRTEEDIHNALGRVDAALELDDTRDNETAKLWRKKAELLERLRDYTGAKEAYEKQLEFDPESYDAPDKIGDLSLKILEEKILETKEAIKGGDTSKQSLLDRLSGERDQAQIGEYERRVKAHPTDMRHRFDLGRVCIRAGDYDRAIENLQQSVSDGKLEINSYLLLAQCFARKEMFDFAKQQCERALATTGGRKNDVWKAATYTLGDICDRAGDFEQALGHFEQLYLIEISYRDVGARYEELRKKVAAAKAE